VFIVNLRYKILSSIGPLPSISAALQPVFTA
jgi:hypothetical protein